MEVIDIYIYIYIFYLFIYLYMYSHIQTCDDSSFADETELTLILGPRAGALGKTSPAFRAAPSDQAKQVHRVLFRGNGIKA